MDILEQRSSQAWDLRVLYSRSYAGPMVTRPQVPSWSRLLKGSSPVCSRLCLDKPNGCPEAYPEVERQYPQLRRRLGDHVVFVRLWLIALLIAIIAIRVLFVAFQWNVIHLDADIHAKIAEREPTMSSPRPMHSIGVSIILGLSNSRP
ncbi:hypothetical protein M422DRAFT_263005 [Sphaerobolus stellatus SS14]|uniref:Uncharacterized protein n=1 Tax=Sphaerobolus stellatus (strain SS14) TaxID=990650 RepID=A0A0C9VBF7_SPHS4|nr:hypothetical protein M422DRAFT_263005 [Sphaerobolus stellatus SS14]